MVANLLETAELLQPIPENVRKLVERVESRQSTIDVGEHSVFIRESTPPGSHYAKATVLFLHGQSYTSSCWEEHGTLATIAALGYHCVAPDLPGCGKTRGRALDASEKPLFILNLLKALGVRKVMLVAASMSAQFVLPLLAQDVFTCVVAVALSNTHEVTQPSAYNIPMLVVWGDRDTSLGPTAAANLRPLPRSRLQKIPGGHACHLNSPREFQQLCVNFFELIRNYNTV